MKYAEKSFTLGLILLLAVLVSTGAAAVYTAHIDNLAEGSVVAKSFIFTSDGASSFQQGVKIAPTETVQWQLTVKNYCDQEITETDLYYKLTFHVTAAAGKSAIEPLVVTVKDTQGNALGTVTVKASAARDVRGAFPDIRRPDRKKPITVKYHLARRQP